MPRDGSGGYLPPQNSWNPAINGAQALPNDWQAILNDIAATLQASLAADGQTLVTGIMNFQNNRISNVGAPIGQGDVLRWEQLIKGSDIPSATTIAVPIEGMCFDVTGTTTITTISDRYPGRMVILRFKDALTLTHSANLQLPDAVNITTTSDDIGIFLNIESGVWRCVSWPNGVYRRGNILGTVSQSLGVPTGALMEYGSNASGQYWRYAGGMQICTARPAISGSAGVWVNTTVTHAAAFASPPYTVGSTDDPIASAPVNVSCRSSDSNTRFVLYAYSTVAFTAGQTVNTVSVGRWF